MIEALLKQADLFQSSPPVAGEWSLRLLHRQRRVIHVRQDKLQPLQNVDDRGAFLSVRHQGGEGYACSPDTSPDGLRAAAEQAMQWAQTSHRHNVVSRRPSLPGHQGRYESPVGRHVNDHNLSQWLDMIHDACRRLKCHDRIADWHAYLSLRTDYQVMINTAGARIEQIFHYIEPGLSVTAYHDGQSQTRTGGGWGTCRQGGIEQIEALGFFHDAERIPAEALQLLDAPPCPEGIMDVLIMPGQMALQIHESIGHPLELDRILGDERNYAGTSFVTLDMFGHYPYGSPLLNVSFDNAYPEEMASYGFDDDGDLVEKTYIIEQGILKRPLGGSLSQTRSGFPGVANSRACHWNRPAIDRMANLNLEPGDNSLQDMISGIENGVLMDTNRSWSIDDSRNKFQFGCEYARRIVDGEPAEVVRNPNYRGISSVFWRNLSAVGNADTMDILGTPHCGKGEPNQMIQVGHASPACVFKNIDVFGGS